MRYNKELLDTILLRDNASLVDENCKLGKDKSIQFICSCGNRHQKIFKNIVNYGGLYCKVCTIQNSVNKVKLTNIEKYGVECSIHNEVIHKKIKEDNLQKYGVEYTICRKETIDKIHNTNIKKFGTLTPLENKEIQIKTKNTLIKNYGVKHPIQNELIKQKMIETNLKRYNTAFGLQNKEIQNKVKQTNLIKYGVENPSQNKEIQEKTQKNAKKFKSYTMPSGTIRKVQGYEPFALNILTKIYTEEQIKTDRKDVPRIKYIVDEKNRYYFPDIFIPHENKLIEVKSMWTIKLKPNIINLKKDACIAEGYNYEIWCFNYKGEKIDPD